MISAYRDDASFFSDLTEKLADDSTKQATNENALLPDFYTLHRYRIKQLNLKKNAKDEIINNEITMIYY